MSIKRKKKKCSGCDLPKYLFGNGLCKFCYNLERAKKARPKKRKRIKKVSAKYRQTLKEYSPKRKKFLDEKPFCEVRLENCTNRSEVIHHKKGKHSKELYLNEEYWMASCSRCNLDIERIGKRAYDLGLKINRGSVEK